MLPAQDRVSTVTIPDYNDFVSEEEEMWLDLVRARIRSGHYRQHDAMITDIRRIYVNAMRYNAKDKGAYGEEGELSGPPAIIM